MPSPMWFGSPPEVHSALLSSGPGSGPLLAAANAWRALSADYRDAASELHGIIATIRAGVWRGPTAEQYFAAHQPFLGWLEHSATTSAARAAEIEEAAIAYAVALADMPTLAELALNHSTHAILLSTNFFGINTLPIAINEGDYARMWLQAASAMSVYDVAAAAARVAMPLSALAPAILIAQGPGAATTALSAEADAVEAGSALSDSQLSVSALLEPLIKVLIPAPVFQIIDELHNLNFAQLLFLLVSNPVAAAGALIPLASAILGLISYVSVSLMLFALQIGAALLLAAPAIVLPLALALSDPGESAPQTGPPTSVQPNATIRTDGPSVDRLSPTLIPPTVSASPVTTSTPIQTTAAPGGPPTSPTGPGSTGSLLYAVSAPGGAPPVSPTLNEQSGARGSAFASNAAVSQAIVQKTPRPQSRRRHRQTDPVRGGSYVQVPLDDSTIQTTPSRSEMPTVSGGTRRASRPPDRARGCVELPLDSDEKSSARVLLPDTWSSADQTPGF